MRRKCCKSRAVNRRAAHIVVGYMRPIPDQSIPWDTLVGRLI